MKPCLLGLAFALATALCHAQPAADPMARRMQACTACHGQQGRATPDGYFPRIAGKPAGYLAHQLLNFRDGRRDNPTMAYLVQNLSDDYLQEIARYFAAIELPYAPPPALAVEPAVLARGQALVRQGDAPHQVPACAACHGERLMGVQPAVPALLGLPRDYLLAQLGAWRNGLRRAQAPDCMKTIADRLSPQDVQAVASWLAVQPVPADAHPQATPPARWPVECGSVRP
jgi:cytochrome c553